MGVDADVVRFFFLLGVALFVAGLSLPFAMGVAAVVRQFDIYASPLNC